MINKLELKNIQAHENSTLEFSPNVNVIIGSSDNGKSAILRGLYWSRYNRPLGSDVLASHWIIDDKGKLKGEFSVTVIKDKSTLTRKRTATTNEYVIDDINLEAVKTDVPEQVESFFNLSETNIQKQLDQPFLLSLSSGEVAKYFNRIVRLDIIDKVLSKAESERRKKKQNADVLTNDITTLEKQKNELQWVNEIDQLVGKYERFIERIELVSKEYELLDTQLNRYNEQKKIINNEIVQLSTKVNEIEKIQKNVEDIQVQYTQLFNTCRTYETAKDWCKHDFTAAKNLIKELDKIGIIIATTQIVYSTLEKHVNSYQSSKLNIVMHEKIIRDNKRLLPNTCPLCGGIV